MNDLFKYPTPEEVAASAKEVMVEFGTYHTFEMYDIIDESKPDLMDVVWINQNCCETEAMRSRLNIDVESIRKQRLRQGNWVWQAKSSKSSVGRNELCPCGSMKKFKKCCGGN